MGSLRLAAWNCHHASLSARLTELAAESVDIAFVQECYPIDTVSAPVQAVTRQISSRKGIALATLNRRCRLSAVASRTAAGGKANVAAKVTGALDCAVIGIWSQGPAYVRDVLASVEEHRDCVRSGNALVMGDLNSGTCLEPRRDPSKGHLQLVDALRDFGLVSAYHVFHGIEHGHETHPTYFHTFARRKPWHIDFCFIPSAWSERLRDVRVLDGRRWRKASDHLPVCVDLRI